MGGNNYIHHAAGMLESMQCVAYELYVIDDGTIELYHPDSGTIYEFGGQGYLQFLKSKTGKATQARKRVKRTLPKMHVKRQRK